MVWARKLCLSSFQTCPSPNSYDSDNSDTIYGHLKIKNPFFVVIHITSTTKGHFCLATVHRLPAGEVVESNNIISREIKEVEYSHLHNFIHFM